MTPTTADIQRLVTALMECVRSIERAKRKGLASQLVLLQAIAAHKSAQPSALSVELGFHLSYLTRQIQALERTGFVDIQVNPKDGRSRLVKLTKSGRAELKRLTQIGLQRFALFVQDWTVTEVQTLASLLEKFEQSKADCSQREPPPRRRPSHNSKE